MIYIYICDLRIYKYVDRILLSYSYHYQYYYIIFRIKRYHIQQTALRRKHEDDDDLYDF